MTPSSQAGDPGAKSARVAVSLEVLPRAGGWFRTQSARRLGFGYALLAPAALYVSLLVAVPFLFSLYLAVSDANVGEQVAGFVGLENFRAALEMDTKALLAQRPDLQVVLLADGDPTLWDLLRQAFDEDDLGVAISLIIDFWPLAEKLAAALRVIDGNEQLLSHSAAGSRTSRRSSTGTRPSTDTMPSGA